MTKMTIVDLRNIFNTPRTDHPSGSRKPMLLPKSTFFSTPGEAKWSFAQNVRGTKIRMLAAQANRALELGDERAARRIKKRIARRLNVRTAN